MVFSRSFFLAFLVLLTEHSSSKGLRIKVFARDSVLGRAFPGGYHFHQRRNFMKDMIQNNNITTIQEKPYIFHMSWTENKENKRKFMEQMGDWYLQDTCAGKVISDITGTLDDLQTTCCSSEPLVTCHYKDKPSKIPCNDSPSLDHFSRSFW